MKQLIKPATERKPTPSKGRQPTSMWNGGGHMQLVLDTAQDSFVAIDADGTIVAWNRAAERTFGWSKTEAIGRPLADVVIPDRLRAAHHSGLQRRLREGVGPVLDRRIELDAIRRDGSELRVELAVSSIEVDGAPLFCGFLHDISERRAREAGRQQMAAIVEASDSAVVSRGIDGTISTWNAAAERIYGYSSEEMIGASIMRLLAPGEKGGAQEQRELLAGRRVESFETREVRKDGSLVDVEVSASPLLDADGEVVGIASIANDIGERKDAERSFREIQARYQSSFYAAPNGMALVGVRGRFLEVNHAICGFLGRSAGDLKSTDFQDLVHPDDADEAVEQRRAILAGEAEELNAERRYDRPDGTTVWGLTQASLLRDDGGEPMYFVVQVLDISERKQAEEELQRYTDQLQELALADGLTEVQSYRALELELNRELEGRDDAEEMTMAIFDVDGLGAINQRQGRDGGDQALREVAAQLAACTRDGDFVARVGGDEFALLLPGRGEQEAREIAARVSAEVASRNAGLGLSYGVAAFPHAGRTRELLLLRADMDLYASKPQTTQASPAGPGGPDSGPLDPAAAKQVERILRFAREHLQMDVGFLGELGSEAEAFRAVAGDGDYFGIETGGKLEIDGTYCRRMVEGRIGNVVGDSSADPEVADLPVTQEGGIGSYIGVPVRLDDQRLYGALCLVDRDARGDLGERETAMMDFLAGLVGDVLSQRRSDQAVSRSQAEMAGIDALLAALAARDHYTGEHSKTVVELATAVAGQLGLDAQEIAEIEQVAVLHDIGKVGIPDSILQKRGSLSEPEWELMRQHPVIGERILLGTGKLAHLAAAVRAEHERVDGAGYPDGLQGTEIPIASRITLACDAYHAMVSDRPYRAALPPEQAREELQRNAGTQFDPAVVGALVEVLAGDVGVQLAADDGGQLASSVPVERRRSPGGDDHSSGASPARGALSSMLPAWRTDAPPGAGFAAAEVRCECRSCGAHAMATVSKATISGNCSNCGSYELEPIPSSG